MQVLSKKKKQTHCLRRHVIFIHEQGSASTSLLQRNFSIGYNRAAKLIDRMEKNGFISGQRGSKARDVFLTESDLERLTERELDVRQFMLDLNDDIIEDK